MQSTPLPPEPIDVIIAEVDPTMPPTVDENGKKHFAYGATQTFKKENMVTLTKAHCHHQFEPDHDDETDYYIAMKCKLCPQGFLARKKGIDK